MEVTIVGGGISGLTLALELHQRGIDCRVYESAPEFGEVGLGISLLPHGTQELRKLGLGDQIAEAAVRFKESCFFNGAGQIIYRDPAPSDWPQFLIHREDLHAILTGAVLERVGRDRVFLGHTCVEITSSGPTARFARAGESAPAEVGGDVIVGCDGLGSRVRATLYPDEGPPAFSNTMMWRGAVEHDPILSGGTHARVGTLERGKLVVYPIRDNVDGEGRQLLNWVIEIRDERYAEPDWTRRGRLEDFLHHFADWSFDWLDVPDMLRRTERIYQFPMVDRDPIDRWAFGRVALLGDAAHPMLPRGSNGAMQAILDARVLAGALAAVDDPEAALRVYEQERLEHVNALVLANRTSPPDSIIELVERRTGFQPFDRIEDVISKEELQSRLQDYKRTAGYHGQALNQVKEVHG